MRDVLNNILIQLKQRVPGLKYIDLDWDQLRIKNAPVKYPCALVGWSSTQWTNEGRLMQSGLAEFVVSVAFNRGHKTSSGASDQQREQGLADLDIVEQAYRALHGWRPSEKSSRMMRTATRSEQTSEGITVYRTTFHVQVVDDSAVRQMEAVNAEMDITITR